MLASRAFSEEREQSSTWRELTAFRDAWTNPDILKKFEGTGILHYTDNQAVVHVLAMGSRNARLYPLVVETILALRKYSIRMKAVWMSRDNRVMTMEVINFFFGDFDMDTMASGTNTKVTKEEVLKNLNPLIQGYQTWE